MDGQRKSWRDRWQGFREHFLAALSAKFVLDLAKETVPTVGGSAAFASLTVGLILLAQKNWTIAIGNVAMLVAFTVVVRRTVRRYRADTTELLKFRSVVESCGIEGFYPMRTLEERKTGWGACVERMSGVRRDELCLAVFTGSSTFGCERMPGEDTNYRSPLRDALEQHRGNLKILLLHKRCRAWNQCIRDFCKGDRAKASEYRRELEEGYQRAFEFCDTLAKKDASELKSIEVRTYDRPPLWKVVIMGNYIWLQHYIPGRRADNLSAYIVNRNADGGLAHPLDSVFDFRWKRAHKVIIHRDEYGKRHV